MAASVSIYLHEAESLLDEGHYFGNPEALFPSKKATLSPGDSASHVRNLLGRYWLAMTLAATVLIVCLIVFAQTVLHESDHAEAAKATSSTLPKIHNEGTMLEDCGSSHLEAQAKGCVFDIMNFGWTPRMCYDDELVEQSLRDGPWEFFYDEAATKPVPGPQNVTLLSAISTVWSSLDFHVSHCLYTWKLLHRATTEGRPLLDALLNFNHTVHCTELILSYAKHKEKISRTDLKFRPCYRLSSRID